MLFNLFSNHFDWTRSGRFFHHILPRRISIFLTRLMNDEAKLQRNVQIRLQNISPSKWPPVFERVKLTSSSSSLRHRRPSSCCSVRVFFVSCVLEISFGTNWAALNASCVCKKPLWLIWLTAKLIRSMCSIFRPNALVELHTHTD